MKFCNFQVKFSRNATNDFPIFFSICWPHCCEQNRLMKKFANLRPRVKCGLRTCGPQMWTSNWSVTLTLILTITLTLTLTLTLSINPNSNPNHLPVRRSGPLVRSLHFTSGPNLREFFRKEGSKKHIYPCYLPLGVWVPKFCVLVVTLDIHMLTEFWAPSPSFWGLIMGVLKNCRCRKWSCIAIACFTRLICIV